MLLLSVGGCASNGGDPTNGGESSGYPQQQDSENLDTEIGGDCDPNYRRSLVTANLNA